MAGITRMYGDTIKVTQLYYVRAAADLGSFSRAAASLGVTQPALSNGIAALENTLGLKLFERSTTGAILTPAAAKVLPHVHTLLAALEGLIAEGEKATGQQMEPLRIGVSPLIHATLLERVVLASTSDFPPLVLQEDNLADLRNAVRARELDVALVPSLNNGNQNGEWEHRPLHTEPVHYLAPRTAQEDRAAQDGQDDHAGRPIDVSELSTRPMVMVGAACGLTAFTHDLFAQRGAQLRPYQGEADSYRSVEAWARLGLGGALLPVSRFSDARQTQPVHDSGQAVQIHYEAFWLKSNSRLDVIRQLMRHLTAEATELLDEASVQSALGEESVE